ncbi:hypothetical protein Nepgr_015112 [Nepenthes gracilis]|uniref:RING-type E3 ubiquitin transferase n=1 Tax=Nepenthes gracilis TaxID=150966 RepID=A0AAD3SN20_NEPGR|nr:hypothetical protein Nepgr_015112 [Nepenthes gracilis]
MQRQHIHGHTNRSETRNYRQPRSRSVAPRLRNRDLYLRNWPDEEIALLEFGSSWTLEFGYARTQYTSSYHVVHHPSQLVDYMLRHQVINDIRNTAFIDTTLLIEQEMLHLGVMQSMEEEREQGNTRLPEEKIIAHLRTKMYTARADTELHICTICQMEYEGEESIGTLNCGHDYHTNCIRKWLAVKNVCPLCNSIAVPLD